MRGEKKPLYRRENKLALHHRSNDPGSEYRYERNTKVMDNFEGTHKSIKSTRGGQDYTPLYKFLLSKVGKPWDEVHSEAVSRIDEPEHIFHMVDLEADENTRPMVRLGESSIFSRLTVKDGILVKVDPLAEPEGRTCTCCTLTFNGKVVHKNSPYLQEQVAKYGTNKTWNKKRKKENATIDHDAVYTARLREGKEKLKQQEALQEE